MGRNSVHGSDSWESAAREIGLWFKKEELCHFDTQKSDEWVYEGKEGILSELTRQKLAIQGKGDDCCCSI